MLHVYLQSNICVYCGTLEQIYKWIYMYSIVIAVVTEVPQEMTFRDIWVGKNIL